MMKSGHRILFAGLLAVASAGTASADDFLITHGASKRGVVASIDLSTSGTASAFEFQLRVPKGAKVDVSKCVAEVPKSHQAQCVVRDGVVHGMVYSLSNERLPAGVVPVGTISIAGSSERLEVVEVLVADDQAQPVSVESTIE